MNRAGWFWRSLAIAFCFVWTLPASGDFAYEEDFTLLDGLGLPYGIEIERNSHYSHGHAKVLDGRYAVLVMGNRHWLTTPALGDFRLEADWSIEASHGSDSADLGWELCFHRDRLVGGGHVLGFMRYGKSQRFVISLDGHEIASRENVTSKDLKAAKLSVDVVRGSLRVLVCGVDCSADIPVGRGCLCFDSSFTAGEQLYLSRVTLTSPETPDKDEFLRRRIEIPACQGFQEPLVYEIVMSRYRDGCEELTCELSGGVASLGRRIETGGKEWESVIEKLESPYVRMEAENGHERTFFLWNGEREFFDERVERFRGKNMRPWPCRRTYRRCGKTVSPRLAAGYKHAICDPWRFAANGPYEVQLDANGRKVYEGESVTDNRVCVKVVSPEDKRIVGKIPMDIPRYAAAVAHARREHYFFDDEDVRFTVVASYRARKWGSDEVALKIALTDVYGNSVNDVELQEGERQNSEACDGLACIKVPVRLARNPGCGVWKLSVTKTVGPLPEECDEEIFEVLSAKPDGPCPPLASGLPVFVSMPNEMKHLEQNAFDPWAAFGGIGHYYAIDNRYPKVGEELEIWRLLSLYRRKWWCWNSDRNSGDADSYGTWARQLMKHADFYGGTDARRYGLCRYELGARWHYVAEQLRMLRDYVVECRPNLKGLTPERANALVERGNGPSFDDLREIFESGWNDYNAYCRKRISNLRTEFSNYLLNVNPKMGFANYGPYAFYISHYKTAYALDYAGYCMEKDPRIRENGSFWLFEEYHHWCDYPLHRPALFVATYDYHYGYGRRIFPEIYYSGWSPCLDGAVYNAHPLVKTRLDPSHQRRIAYQYVYGTPHFKNGQYGYWRDYGFHARTPEKESMEEFVKAWGNVVANRPVRAPKSPFLVVDLDLLRRHGEYFETETNAVVAERDPMTSALVASEQVDICNTGEEALAYAHDRCVAKGYVTPVVCSMADLDSITPDMTDFIVLPPIGPGTPVPVLESIRRLHARGVNLLVSEKAVGLEDLFGVERDPNGPRPIVRIGDEVFSHKLARACYRAAGASVMLCGASHPVRGEEDVPLVFFHKTKTGRTAFVNVPPTVLRRATFRNVYHWGQDSLCEAMQTAYGEILSFLAPSPSLKSSDGVVLGAYTADGDFIVVISDESPIYNDSASYPKAVRLVVREKDIECRGIESDVPYSIVSRGQGVLAVRITLMKDTAAFLKFGKQKER